MKIFYSSAMLMLAINLSAQISPTLGSTDLPNDEDAICVFQEYLGDHADTGYEVGQTVNDFTLWNTQDESFTLSENLDEGKFMLVISGSYTCPRFREKMVVLDEVAASYPDVVETLIVYTLEAHPQAENSPYLGFVYPTPSNIEEGILYDQPNTYGERKSIAQDFIDAMGITHPVFLDDPCNSWWDNFGPAANNAYLIDSEGEVLTHHGWFDRNNDDIMCEIEGVVHGTGDCYDPENSDGSDSGNGGDGTGGDGNGGDGTGGDGTGGDGTGGDGTGGDGTGGDGNGDGQNGEELVGSFDFSANSGYEVTGPAGTILSVTTQIVNNSEYEVELSVERYAQNLPEEWSTAMCLDICLSPNVSATSLTLGAGASQDFTMYFYTPDGQSNQGIASLRIKNLDDPNNMIDFDIIANAEYEEVQEEEDEDLGNPFESDEDDQLGGVLNVQEELVFESNAFPNPTRNFLNLSANEAFEWVVFDTLGKEVAIGKSQGKKASLDTTDWEVGVFFVQIRSGQSSFTHRVAKAN